MRWSALNNCEIVRFRLAASESLHVDWLGFFQQVSMSETFPVIGHHVGGGLVEMKPHGVAVLADMTRSHPWGNFFGPRDRLASCGASIRYPRSGQGG
jgi:hypothetical protein